MLCEWNPRFDTEAGEMSTDGDCRSQATLVVGARTARFKLCGECASRPYFRMFTNRLPLDTRRPQPSVSLTITELEPFL